MIRISDKDQERFYAKVAKGNDADDCWSWVSTKRDTGYGTFYFNGKKYLAHRFSWMLHNNDEVPEHDCVLHRCDNRDCTNPRHLYLGRRFDNARDISRRIRVGKLTKDQILLIKARIDQGWRIGSIMRMFDISRSTVQRIKRGDRWGSI